MATVPFKGMLYAASVLAIVDKMVVQRSADFTAPQNVYFDLARSFAAIASAGAF
jgi:hypothetical protein